MNEPIISKSVIRRMESQMETDIKDYEVVIHNDKEAWDYVKKSLINQDSMSTEWNYINEFDEIGDEDEDNDHGIYMTNNECMYRSINRNTDKDTKCAAGWLIADDYYDPQFEGHNSNSNEVIHAISRSNPTWALSDNSHLMIAVAQGIHDSIDVTYWNEAFDYYKEVFFFEKDAVCAIPKGLSAGQISDYQEDMNTFKKSIKQNFINTLLTEETKSE